MRGGRYPWHRRPRIAGGLIHLSNSQRYAARGFCFRAPGVALPLFPFPRRRGKWSAGRRRVRGGAPWRAITRPAARRCDGARTPMTQGCGASRRSTATLEPGPRSSRTHYAAPDWPQTEATVAVNRARSIYTFLRNASSPKLHRVSGRALVPASGCRPRAGPNGDSCALRATLLARGRLPEVACGRRERHRFDRRRRPGTAAIAGT
jgi:hypothetical protein